MAQRDLDLRYPITFDTSPDTSMRRSCLLESRMQLRSRVREGRASLLQNQVFYANVPLTAEQVDGPTADQITGSAA